MKRILPLALAALLLAACAVAPPGGQKPSSAVSPASGAPAAPAASVPQSLSPETEEAEQPPAPPEDWQTLSEVQTADLFTALGAEDGRTGWRLADDKAWPQAQGFAYPVTTFVRREAGWAVVTGSVLGSGTQRAVVEEVRWDGADTYCLLFGQTGEDGAMTEYEPAVRPWCLLRLEADGEDLTLAWQYPAVYCLPVETDEMRLHAAAVPPEQADALADADESGRVQLAGGGFLLAARGAEAQRYVYGLQEDFLAQALA